MLKRWLLKNTTRIKKCSIENIQNLRKERAQNEPAPTKIFTSSSSRDQRPTKQPYKRKYREEFIKIGFTCILINQWFSTWGSSGNFLGVARAFGVLTMYQHCYFDTRLVLLRDNVHCIRSSVAI